MSEIRDRIIQAGNAWPGTCADIRLNAAAEAIRIVKERMSERHKDTLETLAEARINGEAETGFDFGQRTAYSDAIHDLSALLTEIGSGTPVVGEAGSQEGQK